MTRLTTLLAVGFAIAVGCGTGQVPTATQSTQPSASPRPPSPTALETYAIATLPPKGTTKLTGTLGLDDIEGGCPYLATADGTVYQVVYPEGWRVDVASGVLAGPDGEQVPLGGQVTVRGAVTDMLSTCQIGPVFQASEVVIVSE